MKFYVQTDKDGRIRDIIEFPYKDYQEIEADVPLPIGIMGGAYQLVDGEITYRKDWDKKTDMESLQEENKLLKAQLQALTERSEFMDDCIAEMATKVYSE